MLKTLFFPKHRKKKAKMLTYHIGERLILHRYHTNKDLITLHLKAALGV